MPAPPLTQVELENVLGSRPPKIKNWSFASEPRWAEWIENLNEKATNKLVEERLHRHSLRRLQKALRETQNLLILRNREIEIMVASAIAQVNVVFLGPPGTGKSLLVRKFAEALGVKNEPRHISEESTAVREARERTGDRSRQRRYFEYLLTRYTTPEELFGGVDIEVLLNGSVHARCTSGMLPQAEIAFLDEIFKANSAILNTLLSLTNERIFFNLGQSFRVNLAFVVGASNESPDLDELGALYDRFPIRVPCHPVPDKKIKDVIEKAQQLYTAGLFKGHKRPEQEETNDGEDAPKACLNDLRLLTKVAGSRLICEAEDSFMEEFCELTRRLRGQYAISDRSPAQVLRVCRALALLETDPETQPSLGTRHLRAWGYVAPRFQDAAVLQRFVQDHISGKDPKAANLFEPLE